jgi:zinc transport system ATP-binding protein
MLVKANDLTVRLGGAEVLSHVSLAINGAEIVTVLGPNGSGKSTLLRALLGMVPLSGGTVTRAPGLRIGYVPQKLSIDPSLPLTVRRFLSLPHRVTEAEAKTALSRVGMDDTEAKPMSGLSGGQLQRVMLARALLAKPGLLVLDEPTQGLDQPGEASFYRLIEEVRQQTGAAVLMVSHDLHVVMAASDRVICLNHHICCQGTPRVVSAAPEYRALFGLGTQGALALYQHRHDHSHGDQPGDQSVSAYLNDHSHGELRSHDHDHDHDHGHDHGHNHDHDHENQPDHTHSRDGDHQQGRDHEPPRDHDHSHKGRPHAG